VKAYYDILKRPHITEKSVALSYGNPNIRDAEKQVRKYTFIVHNDANKLEIKHAIEELYNRDRKDVDKVTVTSVRTVRVLGKKRRRGAHTGYEPNEKKAIVTLAPGQMLEDFGV
jgi:large subunit ribosomal protein L23